MWPFNRGWPLNRGSTVVSNPLRDWSIAAVKFTVLYCVSGNCPVTK